MNIKPAALISYNAAGIPRAELVGDPAEVLAEFRSRMKAGGLGAHQLVALTGRGIEKRAKFDPPPIVPEIEKKSTRKVA